MTERNAPDASGGGGLRAVFLIAGAASFMAALDNLVVTTALPRIRQDLGGSLETLEWTVHSYTLMFAVFMLGAAVLGDRFGRRRVLLSGLALFTVASAVAASSVTPGMLIAARAVQGLGGSVIFPLSLTVLVTAAPPARRGLAIAGLSVASGLAIALGPFVGGLVVELGSWHWIFWLNVPVGLLIVPLGLRLLPESRGPQGRLDVVGTVLLTLAVFGPVWGLVRSVNRSWSDVQVWGPAVAGLLLLGAVVVWVRRTPQPVVPPRVFTARGFRLSTVVSLLTQAGMFGSIFLITQFLQGVLGYSPLVAGARTLPWTVMPLIVAPLSAVLADRIGIRWAMAAGCLLQGLALGWFVLVISPTVHYGLLLPGMVVGGIGMGLFFGLGPRQALDFVRRDDQGVGSGVNNAVRQLGAVLGIAVLSAVFSGAGGTITRDGFLAGFDPALLVGCLLLGLATLVAIAVPPSPPSPPPPPSPSSDPSSEASEPAEAPLPAEPARRVTAG